jgi:hypothetical protein
MEKHILSKSTFIRAKQCLKSLYLYKNHIYLRDKISKEQQARFNRGINVGLLAQQLFPNGVNASPENVSLYHQSIIKTKQLIEKGTKIIYEAAFQHRGILVALDILVNEDGVWNAYEIKSSAKLTPTYITDAALQYNVISGSGINIENFFIVHINTSYVREGEINVHELFKKNNITKEILLQQKSIEETIALAFEILQKNKIPDIEPGPHCFEPYTCDFKGYCWKNFEKTDIFEFNGLSKQQQFDWFNKGWKRIEDVPPELLPNNTIRKQALAAKNNSILIDKEKIEEFVKAINYPLSFLDFEIMMPAVPLFQNTSPYQQLPFLFSMFEQQNINCDFIHYSFLSETGEDPRKSFVEALIRACGNSGTIFVYDISSERSIINQLIKAFPEHEKRLQLIISRLVDLSVPFRELFLYHPKMKGSTSIKNVATAFCDNINFDSLPISNGQLASIAFESLQQESDLFKIMEVKDQLEAYCKLDTWAMVRIWQKINKIIHTS